MPSNEPPVNPGRPPFPPPVSRLNTLPKVLLLLAGFATGLCVLPVIVVAAISAGATPNAQPTTQDALPNVVIPPTTTAPTVVPAPIVPPTTAQAPSTPAAAPTTPKAPTTTKTTTKPPPPKPKCDPNYIWQCVPIASDVDCGGGRGNGPAYVWGTVKVVGSDIYDLDRDGDGIGCEN